MFPCYVLRLPIAFRSSPAARLATYNATRYQLARYVTVMGVQGVLRNAYRFQAAVACRQPATQMAESQVRTTR